MNVQSFLESEDTYCHQSGTGLLQGCLAHEKLLPPRALQYAYAYGPVVVLGGMKFLESEVPLYLPDRTANYARML